MEFDYFPIWQKRLHDNIETVLDKKAADGIKQTISFNTGNSIEERQKWIGNMTMYLDENLSDNKKVLLMESCGRLCLMSAFKEGAKEAWKRTGNIKDFINLMNKDFFGEGHLTLEGNTIYGKHESCLCPIVQTYDVNYPSFYCNCSQGWVKELFETAMGKPVKVELLASVVRGDGYCQYKVEI